MNPIRQLLPFLFMAFAPALSYTSADEFLPTATPESQGIPSEAILQLVQAAEAHPDRAAHSVIIVRNGFAVAEGYWAPYAQNQAHELYSLSKSFTSTAVGLAVKEGLLRIDDRVIDFFPDLVPDSVPDNMKNMLVRHLLSMSTGHKKEPEIFWSRDTEKTIVQLFLESNPNLEPGSHFLYNTPASYMLSAIVQKLTGQRVRDYLLPRLFEPLGIEKQNWDQSRDGVDFGGFGLLLKTRDIAKFGQLLLQKGKWKDHQLIPEDWIEMATRKQISNGEGESDWNNGYGFQFWINSTEGFRGDGAFGQLCIVLPKANMVIAMNAATTDMGGEMRWIWDILLPALSTDALPENPAAQMALQEKLDSLELSRPKGDAAPNATIAKDSGTFRFEDNLLGIKTARVYEQSNQLTLDLELTAGAFSLPIGIGEWIEADFIRSNMSGLPEPAKAFLSGAWETPNILNISIVHEGRCQKLQIQFKFNKKTLTLVPSVNVAFGPTEMPEIVGELVQ